MTVPTATPTDTSTPTITNTPTVTSTPTVTNTPTPTSTPAVSTLCADSYTFPLDTGDVYTVDLCSNVDGIMIGSGVFAILLLIAGIFLWQQVRRIL